jgi:hypothetical protein
MTGDPGKHPRADLLSVVEREDEIRPVRPFQDTMRTSPLTFDDPADAEQG